MVDLRFNSRHHHGQVPFKLATRMCYLNLMISMEKMPFLAACTEEVDSEDMWRISGGWKKNFAPDIGR